MISFSGSANCSYSMAKVAQRMVKLQRPPPVAIIIDAGYHLWPIDNLL
jgi:hypothetical protein